MPHIANTPESLLGRNDSLNPATTCKGITANGRPCRRPLASSTNSSPAASPRRAVPQTTTDPSAQYCWQHKDQAPSVQAPTNRPEPSNLKPRTSIDTLMDRLGVLDLNDAQDPTKRRDSRRRTNTASRKQKKRTTLCCCIEVLEDDDPPRPARPSSSRPQSSRPAQSHTSQASNSRPSRPQSMQQVSNTHPPTLLSPPQRPNRPSIHSTPNSSSSQTKSLLAWIPPELSPQTTSTLLTELAKPISDADEPGYIYMFWVTPSSAATTRGNPPPSDLARSLFPPDTTRPNHSRSVSDALQTARDLSALTSSPTGNSPGTLRLKIGRTSNVHRRLNEWTKQCSHDLTLIRYYPYTSSHSSSGGAGASGEVAGRKVPHVHRVERLIHLELGDIRVRDLGRCDECGKEHREWFEVAAEKPALRRVDECIRRWVKWAESR